MIFRGFKFSKCVFSGIFQTRVCHQGEWVGEHFFQRRSISTNSTAKKKFWGRSEHPGPVICLNARKRGFSWFLDIPIFHQNPSCGFGGCRSGPKILGKKLGILGYILKKNIEKFQKLAKLKKLYFGYCFFSVTVPWGVMTGLRLSSLQLATSLRLWSLELATSLSLSSLQLATSWRI